MKITDDHFYHYLSKFLVSRTGGKYQRNFVFNETFMCGKIAPRIIATTIEFKFTLFVSPSEWIPAMDDSKHLVSKAQIEGYVTVWSKFFGPWTSDKMITQEVSRNLILGLICVMCTTAILIVEVHTCFWILLCILLTLLNVCGFMYFWGQPIDMVSSIGEYISHFLLNHCNSVLLYYLTMKDKNICKYDTLQKKLFDKIKENVLFNKISAFIIICQFYRILSKFFIN